MITTRDRLDQALRAEADAVACCIAVAQLDGETADDVRRGAAEAAITAYEAAAGVADALMDVIIAQGGMAGLLELLHGDERRAQEQFFAVYPIVDTAAYRRAWAIAEHAQQRAYDRTTRVDRDLVGSWLQRRQEAANA